MDATSLLILTNWVVGAMLTYAYVEEGRGSEGLFVLILRILGCIFAWPTLCFVRLCNHGKRNTRKEEDF